MNRIGSPRAAHGAVPVAMVILLGVTIGHANLIQNGSFELSDTVDPGFYFVTLNEGSTDINGWVVESHDIDYVGEYWPASDGVRSLDLCGTWDGGIHQTFSTFSGLVYSVSFDLAGNGAQNPSVKQIQVEAAGQSAIYTYDVNNEVGWKHVQWFFTAVAESSTLGFRSIECNSAAGPVLDNVVVNVVPEPNVANLVLVVACLTWMKRRFRRRSAPPSQAHRQ